MTEIAVPAPAGALPTYLAVPDGPGPFPGVVVLHANRGTGEKLERILTAVGVDHDIRTYPEAGHGFLNDHDPADVPAVAAVLGRLTGGADVYHEPSARDARERILAFLGRHLGPGSTA